MEHPIKTALLSVSDKTGLIEFARFLHDSGVKLLSTGGTAKAIADAGLPVIEIAEHTGFPEMMDGRIKTLHPTVHGGLLARRDTKHHVASMQEHGITGIDLLVVNLYPFEATVAKGANFDECVEQIDIGGPAMVRSASKNHAFVTVVVDPDDYKEVIAEMEEHNGLTTLSLRKKLALKAFSRTASYDAAISQWFAKQLEEGAAPIFTASGTLKQALRYGENPHQSAALYRIDDTAGVTNAKQLQGKELSYNNIADTDAAFDLVSEFGEPACAIIKHANPCGVAVAKDIVTAYNNALACDPVSAYGGILAFNRPFTKDMVEALGKLFAEVIIAPKFESDALELLSAKKNLRLLETGSMPNPERVGQLIKSVAGGLLVQSRDAVILKDAELKVVTKRAPNVEELRDLRFAFTVCKHVKSNAIVFAKDNASIGIGAGQMSRIDSSRIGSWKAKETATSVEDARGSVLASDAFFPFADGLISAAENGITAVIQPGGSIRDEEVIAAADERNIAMIFTGIRHFKH